MSIRFSSMLECTQRMLSLVLSAAFQDPVDRRLFAEQIINCQIKLFVSFHICLTTQTMPFGYRLIYFNNNHNNFKYFDNFNNLLLLLLSVKAKKNYNNNNNNNKKKKTKRITR